MGDVTVFYPEFVPNQILTNTQLNQLREHLASQGLRTRLRLGGIGIACGWGWAVSSAVPPAIVLGGGYGISSAGELIEQCDPARYTHHRPYADPDRDEAGALRYPQWRDPADATHQTQRAIIELVDEAAMAGADAPEDAVAFTAADFAGPGSITTGRVLVLYLEHEPVDLNSCLVTSCDNKGLNINVRVRALLVKSSDLTPAPECAAPPELERIPRMHTVRKPEQIANAAQLAQTFGDIVAAHAPVLGRLIKALFDAHAEFLGVEPFQVADPLAGKLVGGEPAQDRYDALADFAAAYNEAAVSAYPLVEQCCPTDDFPRHLMLGALDSTPSFRSEFQPAAIRNVMHGELDHVRTLFLRLRAMVDSLSLGASPGAATIQPSHGAEYPLGRRAQPFYFAGVAADLWRPRPRCSVDPDWPWRRPLIATGLDTDYADTTWLRIEGHVGTAHAAAAGTISRRRDAGNAEFCLLRTYFADRSAEETSARSKIADRLLKLIQVDDQTRNDVVMGLLKREFEPAAKFARERLALTDDLGKVETAWLTVRDQRELHCSWAALGSEYLEARSELFCVAARTLGMLRRLRLAVDLVDAGLLIEPGLDVGRYAMVYALLDRVVGAITAAPQDWDTVEKVAARIDWEALPKLEPREWLRLALRIAIETLHMQLRRMLEETLPKSLAAFDYEFFAARHREVVRGLLEFQLWTGALGTGLTGASGVKAGPDRDAPLHPVERGIVEADLLALARSGLAARLAAAFSAYEALRAADPSLYRNLAKIDGLEHRAGVGKGGSFILLCDTSANAGRVLGDFSLDRCLPCCCELDPGSICLPPVALPDVRVVKLLAGKEGYAPVELSILVGANDYDLNGAEETPPQVAIELLAQKSELGATLEAHSETATIAYRLEMPSPGVVDRFRYRLRIKGVCSGEAIAEVALVLATDPLFAGRIEGDVLNPGGDGPAGGATVRVIETGVTTVADAKGHFVFERVPAGRYSLQASLGTLRSEAGTVNVGVGATATAELMLLSNLVNGTVVVRVVDEKAAPISKASVTLKADSAAFVQTSFTLATGETTFANVPVGSYSATASASGYLSGLTASFGLAGGETASQVIRLGVVRVAVPAATVDFVVGAKGISVVEASVLARRTLEDRRATELDAFNRASVDPKLVAAEPRAKASEFLANGLTDSKTSAEIETAYKDTASVLVDAAKQATGQAKVAYQEMLSAVSLAYLDHLVATSPATLTTEASNGAKLVGSALKAAGITAAAARKLWNGEALTGSLGVKTVAGVSALLG